VIEGYVLKEVGFRVVIQDDSTFAENANVPSAKPLASEESHPRS
jgi:hypothetical protein